MVIKGTPADICFFTQFFDGYFADIFGLCQLEKAVIYLV